MSTSVRHLLALATAAVMLLGLLAMAPAANAQLNLVVTSDHIGQGPADDDPVPDSCDPGDCSLREAIIAANGDPGSTITFESGGTIELSPTGSEEGADANFDDLDIMYDVTIVGHPDGTTVDAGGLTQGANSRTFDLSPAEGGLVLTVVVEDLAIINSTTTEGGGAIRSEGPTTSLTLRDVVITDSAAERGGAVTINGGALIVEDSMFSDNVAQRRGGAIALEGPESVIISGSTFTDNVAGQECCGQSQLTGRGGAISAVQKGTAPPVQVIDSSFLSNHTERFDSKAPSMGPGGWGGAIYSSYVPFEISGTEFVGNGINDDGEGDPEVSTEDGGALYLGHFDQQVETVSTITNSSLSGNEAYYNGGGIFILEGTRVTIDDSTINNNATTEPESRGGGIFQRSLSGLLVITNSTISGNTSGAGGGGGIHSHGQIDGVSRGDIGRIDLRHVTLADNSGQAGIVSGRDGAAVTYSSTLITGNQTLNCQVLDGISQGFNLEDRDDCGFGQASDLPDTDPVIGPLADNGGRPQGSDGTTVGLTHALLVDSPAIDTADPEFCPDPIATDERGITRPQLAGCDIGAFEYVEQPRVGELDINKVAVPALIPLNDTSTFTIDVTNVGDGVAEGVTMTDEVPDGLTISSVTPADACDIVGQAITCDLGDLDPGATITVTIDVVGSVRGTYTNTGTVVFAETTPVSDDADLIVVEDGVGGECIGNDTSTDSQLTDGINRIQGLNRIQTAIAASQAACGPGEAPAVILTRSDLFPDAQAGTPLAVDRGAPLLLSAPATLDSATETEIQRILNPGGVVYLLGGTVALSDAVNDRLEDLGYMTIRYGGINRFETAAIIAEDGLDNPDTLLVANGGDFADSIVAGAAASNVGMSADVQAAVLLTSDVNIPPETQAYLDGLAGADPTLITIGIDAGVAFPAPSENISGPSRFETAVAVAERFFTDPTLIGVARADDFPDGLTGGALVGRRALGPGPMILVATDELPDAVAGYLSGNAGSITRVVIFGGTAAVSQQVEDDIAAALGL